MSQYFEGYNYSKDNYDNNSQFTDDNKSELSAIKKYSSDEDTESDVQVFEFKNNYSTMGGICVLLIIIIILVYIYFNHYKK